MKPLPGEGGGPLGDRALPGGPFWLVNGDIVAEGLDPQPIVDAFGRSGSFAACWLSDTQGPHQGSQKLTIVSL